MNAKQRKELEDILNDIDSLISRVEIIKDEEQEKLDNMPENLQGSERYSQFENSIQALEDCISNLESSKDDLQMAIEQ